MKGQARLWELQSFTWTPGVAQSLVYDIRSLPAKHRVTHFMLCADFNVTTAGASGALPFDVSGLLIDSIYHESEFFKLRGTGYSLGNLFHHMNGKTLNNVLFGAAILAGRAPTVIPLADMRAKQPLDTAIPTELLNNTSIQVNTTAITEVQLFGAAAVAPMSLRLYAALTDGAGPIDPAATRIDYEDWGGQTINMKAGVYSHVNIFDDRSGTTVAGQITTGAEITRVNLTHAGQQIVNNALSWALVLDYNRAYPGGGFENNDTEQLDDVTVSFLPVYTAPNGYSLAQLPGGKAPTTQMNLSGTQTTVRVGYRAVTFKEQSQIRAAAAAFEMKGPYGRRMKTASKQDTARGSNAASDVERRSRLSELIPGRLVGVNG
jgi:hypothetical protein